MAGLLVAVGSGFGADGVSASLSGPPGSTYNDGSTLYVRQGAGLTLSVTTDPATKCVRVTDGVTTIEDDSGSGSSWTFTSVDGPLFVGASGDGVHKLTVTAFKSSNAHGCTSQTLGQRDVPYVADNTPPQVTGAKSPAANAAGWNHSDVAIAWSATDAGSGVASGPTPSSDDVTANTAGATKTATAVDHVGNSGTGSVTVKLDKDLPTVTTAQRSPAPNANGWNNTDVSLNVACADALSGIKSCTGGGSTTFSQEGAGQSVTVTATDNADNAASLEAPTPAVNIDKTPPALSGAPTAAPNGAGWYRGDVTIHWSCSDALSGLDGACPADEQIGGEGTGLKATRTVSDKAGNSITADSAAVKIDRTAPNTNASAVGDWNNVDMTVALDAHDALSGVEATHYTLDGGGEQTGTQVHVADEGVHELRFWSVDKAGNIEAAHTVQVKIDKTKPTIGHLLTPEANANGWNRADTTVHFVCDDDQSGIASCTPDRVVSEEGAGLIVKGTAVDNAGNSAEDPATVSLDKTDPTIHAAADRAPNGNGWYDADVTVAFSCDDALSGVDACPAAEVLSEGAGQSASGTARDAAGNTATAEVHGIDVDETAPTLHGAATTDPNADGWYRDDVTVHWTCDDALSGLAGDCPADTEVTGEGDDLAASASVRDKAGNVATETVGGLKIDRSAPSTSADVPAPLASGWYASGVEVELAATDGLSGVGTTYYRVDDGDAHVYTGPFTHDLKGVHRISFWSVDRAGNVEDSTAPGHELVLKIDGIAPAIGGQRQPEANAFGWNNQPVTVSFFCSDEESGVAGCSDPVTLSDEGADQSVPGNAVDNAGNHSSTSVDHINIDLTKPTLTGAPTTDPNAAGWYRGDVTVHWTGADGLSGIDPATAPADSVVDGEGADLGAGPETIADKAGNVSDPATVAGIKIDRTGPAIEGAPKTAPNADGWYSGDVVVGFSCEDALSGVASCPSDKLLTGNGADQSVTSDPATDVAGNSTPGKTVGGINIDGAAPQTKADNQCTLMNGWCVGSTATIVLTATDQPGLSGVKEIRYRVDGGEEQVAPGSTASVVVPLDGGGRASVTFYAVDRAGNREPANGVALNYDNIAPTVTHTLDPAANADGWHHGDVRVHFDARDNDGGSGVDASRTTPDVTVADESPATLVKGEAYDLAGNRGTDAVTVKLDKTAPSISGAVVEGRGGDNGWYTGPVTVHFTCSDEMSGVAVCPDDVVLTANGAGQSVTRQAADYAGNRASATVSGIDIDQEPPAITLRGIKDGGIYTLGAVPAGSCTATDGVSGPVSCRLQLSQSGAVGTVGFTATATDVAGNTSTLTGTYRVVYRFGGFRQPINDTAHDLGAATSMFKAGSTVPAKVQVTKADGTVVQPAAAPQWLAPVKGSPTTAPVDESLYGGAADSGSSFRWDGSEKQYVYNWNTDKAQGGYYWRVGVRLDDGQTYYANIGLR